MTSNLAKLIGSVGLSERSKLIPLLAISAGGATGGGSDQVFIENDQTVTTNYTISTNKNAVSAGTVTINSGISVTVPTGARWVVV